VEDVFAHGNTLSIIMNKKKATGLIRIWLGRFFVCRTLTTFSCENNSLKNVLRIAFVKRL
jgi:hypothetical protein